MKTQTIRSFIQRLVRHQGFWAFVFVATVGVCYLPAVSGPFFFDDEHFILKNEMVHSLDRAGDIYTSTVTQGASIKGNFYRPNQQMTFALIYHLAGVSTPVPYHLVSLALHTLNAVLFQAWLIMLGIAAPAAGLMALFWLVHPIQTEAVSYISGLSDPLALLFMFGGLLWYGRLIKQRKRPVALPLIALPVLVWLVLALLCKENGVVFAPLALGSSVYVAVSKRERLRRDEGWVLLGITVVVGIYLVLKMTVLNFSGGFGLSMEVNEYTESLVLRLTTFISVLWEYAVMIFFPRDLFYEKPYLAYASLASARGIFGLAALAAGGVAIFRAKKNPLVALGAFIVVAGLLPFSGVIPLNAMFLEHWLYVPMLGVAILLVAGWQALPKGKWRHTGSALFCLILVACGGRTFVRNLEWSDIESFYLNELAHGGSSTRIYNNLGMYYADKGDANKAIIYYKLAVEASSKLPYPQPHHNLARAYAEAGRLNEAVDELRKALAVDSNFTYSLSFLHEVFVAVHDERRAKIVADTLTIVENGGHYDVSEFNAAVFGSP